MNGKSADKSVSARSADQVTELVTQLGARLERAGVRVSPRRRAILNALVAEQGHPTPEELGLRMRESSARISLTTIYRFLRVLAEHRIVRTIRIGDSTRVEVDDGDGVHDHILCGECGRILELHDEALRRRVRSLVEAHGFGGAEPTIEIHTTCSNCNAPRS